MRDDERETRLTQLVGALDETCSLLARYGAHQWARWLAADCERIADGDLTAIDHLLAAFGGMGSLNDVVLSHLDGPVDDTGRCVSSGAGDADDRLDALRTRIFTDATALRAARHRGR
jgi:hypothetical protein